MKKLFITAILFSLIIILGQCGKKMPLPTVVQNPESFGANDTSYNKAATWDASFIGYSPRNPMTPLDISIGGDGFIFVADSANDKVLTISESGFLVTANNLNTIEPVSHPVGVDIDAKLNLLIVNGTNKIYVWNQYLNTFGVDSVLVGVVDDTNYIFSANQTLIDSITGIHVFYEDDDPNSQFQGIAFGPSQENTVFVTDNGNNRILRLNMYYSGAVVLTNGYLHPTFAGHYDKDIATFGSGAGTVDNPRGITTDDEGNVYFTQIGGNFLVQKLKPQTDSYISEYTLYEDPIMDLNRFSGPHDLALGENDAIFVLDTAEGIVTKYHNRGTRAGQLANLGKKGLSEAEFARPRGIAVSAKETVYITNTGNNTIESYQYSVSDSDIPEPEIN